MRRHDTPSSPPPPEARFKVSGLLRLIQGWDFPHKLGVCERLFARALAQHGIRWVDTAAGIPWKLDLGCATHRWIVYGKYEGGPFLDWAKAYLRTDAVIVDSGANIGQMLLYYAQWIPTGKVLAFEPGKEAADWLAECLQANPSLPVELIRVGLGAATCRMSLAPVGPAEVHGACNQIRALGEGPTVDVVRLADILAAREIRNVDLWKLDVEGFELEALSGAEEPISEKRIGAIYCELGFGKGERICAHMDRMGYDCYLFDAKGRLCRPKDLPEHINGLFLPR